MTNYDIEIGKRCRELWADVLRRAEKDLTFKCGDKHRVWAKKREDQIQAEARTFCKGNSLDFRLVCNLAGLDPSYVARNIGKPKPENNQKPDREDLWDA